MKKKIHVRNRLYGQATTWCGKAISNVESYISGVGEMPPGAMQSDMCGQCARYIKDLFNRYEDKWFLNNETR